MTQTALYVWDDAVFVLAADVDEARRLAQERTRHLRSLYNMVTDIEPRMFQSPAVHLVFHCSRSRPSDEPIVLGCESAGSGVGIR